MQDLELYGLTLDATNATSLGTGISLAYCHQSNFSWKAFVDYDTSRKTFTANTCLPSFAPDSDTFEHPQRMHSFTVGASFSINF